jgi:acyl-CoA synthetase (NDP forming)
MAHRLDPLLRPASIAVIGATPRAGAVGQVTLANLRQGRYRGRLYAVNPRHREVCGVRCYASLETLPERVEHAVFAVADDRLEAALDAAIAHGVKAVTLVSSLVLADDREPPLKDRIRAKVARAGLLVCGGNGMGFYNFTDRVWACGFATRPNHRPGSVCYLSHSGSGMCGIVDCEERLDFNLVVSTGQELTVAMHEYLDFALDQPETRVVGLFVETARDPVGLVRAFEKAARKGIPIVAIKVGRTGLAAELTVSHTGALAGRDSTWDALFDRYGVQRVADMDELATALIMFSQPHAVAAGGLVTIHDSGGERQLIIDLAEAIGVPFARLAPSTTAILESLLDPGLPAVNPLDAWSTGGPEFHTYMSRCLTTMMADGAAALGAVIHDRAPEGRIYADYAQYLRAAHAASGKPMFLVSNRQGPGADPLAVSLTREGFPVLDGVAPFLRGVRALLAWRDFRARPAMAPPQLAPGIAARWRERLAGGDGFKAQTAFELLADFGVPVTPVRLAEDVDDATAAAGAFGYPVVLKTAAPGVAHKTEVDGIRLDLNDEPAVAAAYRDLASRLGPRVLIAPMVTGTGVEMILGIVGDDQFGPVVALGFGGTQAEVLDDVAFALPPFDAPTAERLLGGLRLRPLLDGVRGAPALDVRAFCMAAARFSVLADALRGVIDEIDLNPVIVQPRGCIAVDALIVPADRSAMAARSAAG